MADEVEIVVSDKFISRGGFGAAKKGLSDIQADAAKTEKSVGSMNEELTGGFSRRGGTDKIVSEFDRLPGQLGKAGQRAGREAGDGVADGAADGVRSGRGQVDSASDSLFQNLGKRSKSAGREAGEGFSGGIGDGVGSGKGSVASSVEGLFGGLGKAGFIGAAGAAAGAFFMEAFNQHIAADSAKGQLQAQFGLTGSEAKAAGKEAGKVYYQGFGESVGDVAAVTGKVQASFKNLAAEGRNSSEDITKGALGISKVFSEDVNEVIRATSSILKNGLAPDAKTALDIITTGFQNGLNSGGDFLDTIVEYSPYFRQLGLSAQDGLGLVSQMLQAGARDADYAADAIKEFGIRSIDGSKPVTQAFKDLGFSAEEMSAKIAAGGPQAKEAFGQVITALQGIKDPVAQNTAGVALFGTQWEDTVRAILPNIDLTKTGFENTAGAVDKMNKAVSETDESKLAAIGRKFEEAAGKAADFATKTNKMEFVINFDANMGMADEQFDGFVNKINAATPQVNINGNANNATAALEQIQHEIDAGHGTVIIDGNPMDAQAAKQMVIDSINESAGTVTINGNTYPAGTKVNELLGNVNASQAAISVQAYTAAAEAAIDYAARNRQATVFVNTVGTVGGNSVVHSYAHGGIVSAAATGGQRGGDVVMNEQGPEAVRLPNGSTVIPAGATRALEQRWAEGGGGGGEVMVSFDTSGITDRAFVNALIGMLRVNGKKVPGLTVAA